MKAAAAAPQRQERNSRADRKRQQGEEEAIQQRIDHAADVIGVDMCAKERDCAPLLLALHAERIVDVPAERGDPGQDDLDLRIDAYAPRRRGVSFDNFA